MKLSLAANLVVNWVFPVLAFPECIQPITAAALCTVAINVLVARAFNPKSQYFIPLFNKISWLCRQQPGGDEASKEGCNSGSKRITVWITLLSTNLQGLEHIPETITWKQLNAIKNPFSCDFNKNATRPCSRALSDDCWLYKVHFRSPQMSERQWIHDTSPYVSTLKSPDKFSENERLHQKLFLANGHLPGTFCRQLWWTLWIYGQWGKCKVKVGKHTLTRRPLQVAYPTHLSQFQPHRYVFP